jgi:hypothetical protein
MDELSLTVDMVEEKIVKGNFRWLANFSEIIRDFQLEDLRIPLYASGGLEEKGFLLSRLFSTLVTPKYKVHFLLHTATEHDEKLLRKIVLACKRKFGEDAWVFLGLVQNKTMERSAKSFIERLEDPNVGIVACSLASKEEIVSKNVLGRGLRKQLKLTEAKFEAFDVPDYAKSLTIAMVFCLVVMLSIQVVFALPIFTLSALPFSVMGLLLFSVVVGHSLYKSRYHTALLMTTEGFELRKGPSVTKRKWADFRRATVYVSPKHEASIRLYGEIGKFDLPVSRTGLSRKDAYDSIAQLIRLNKNKG